MHDALEAECTLAAADGVFAGICILSGATDVCLDSVKALMSMLSDNMMWLHPQVLLLVALWPNTAGSKPVSFLQATQRQIQGKMYNRTGPVSEEELHMLRQELMRIIIPWPGLASICFGWNPPICYGCHILTSGFSASLILSLSNICQHCRILDVSTQSSHPSTSSPIS